MPIPCSLSRGMHRWHQKAWYELTQFAAMTSALLLALAALAAPARAQELTPGAYTPYPTGIQYVGISTNLSHGDITFDPTLPIEDARATVNTTLLTAGYIFGLGGRMANILVAVPLSSGDLEGSLLGVPQEVHRTGLADSQVRLGINLYGAPALPLKEFVRQERKGIVGASVTIVLPLGQYDSSKLVNLGSHRWAFKPEAGVSRAVGRWRFEAYGGVWLFTANDDFSGGRVRTQNPLASLQFHLFYTFRPKLWLAFNGNFYSGGRTSIDGVANIDFQKNSRVGATLAVPVGNRHTIRGAVSRGAYTTIGADFTSVSIAYQYTWGGGL